MNVSYQWLRALVPGLTESPDEVGHRLAMLGAPPDAITALGRGLEDIVVGRVIAARSHPNADRLGLCEVDAGEGPVQVVCGAPNVEQGRAYAFAPVGATLPDGTRIRKAKIRGESSQGMLCSERELGLGRDHAGIMALSGDPSPGASLVEATGLNDVRLELDVTPNRPDLLSHVGVAREVAPAGEGVRLPKLPDSPEAAIELATGQERSTADGVEVRVEDADGCLRYMGAVVRGVRVGPSPSWLAARLRAVGLRPINNVVDATNYVLYELGQPLHAFDLARLSGPEIRVRAAREGEPLRTLDGVDRRLEAGTLVIADAERPVAVAGVMGGDDTEVTGETTDVLLECALFDPKRVRIGRRSVGLSTDASFRYERGVDPDGMERALRRALALILGTAGGTAAPQVADVHTVRHEPATLTLRASRVEQVLGVRITPAAMADLLAPLGFDVQAGSDAVSVGVPGHRRYDIEREIDLVEEVARRYGYDNFPDEARPFRAGTVPDDARALLEDRLRDWLVGRGLIEARSTPFAARGAVEVLNPLSAEESALRAELLPGLVGRTRYNFARGRADVRFFELGTAFGTGEDGALPREERRLAVLLTGARAPRHWSAQPEAFQVWDLKGLMEELPARMGVEGVVEPCDESDEAPDWLTGAMLVLRTAAGTILARGGRVDPGLVAAPAWVDAPVWGFEAIIGAPVARGADGSVAELPLDGAGRADIAYRPVPSQPAVERDLALIVPEGVPAAHVEQVIRGTAGPLLEDVGIFDLYTGEAIGPKRRSIAYRMRYRAPDRTLRDAEVDEAVGRVVAHLEEALGVERRG